VQPCCSQALLLRPILAGSCESRSAAGLAAGTRLRAARSVCGCRLFMHTCSRPAPEHAAFLTVTSAHITDSHRPRRSVSRQPTSVPCAASGGGEKAAAGADGVHQAPSAPAFSTYLPLHPENLIHPCSPTALSLRPRITLDLLPTGPVELRQGYSLSATSSNTQVDMCAVVAIRLR
jgi:hypothetical protein